jgi:hypothetical protein
VSEATSLSKTLDQEAGAISLGLVFDVRSRVPRPDGPIILNSSECFREIPHRIPSGDQGPPVGVEFILGVTRCPTLVETDGSWW